MKGFLRAAAGAALVLASLAPGVATTAALAQDDPRTSGTTGYTVSDDAVWGFYLSHGANLTFGEPISREFTLFGKPTQLFDNAALQVQSDGSVVPLQLTDPSYFTSNTVDGLTVPPPDGAMAFVAPTPDDSNYASRMGVFLQATVPNTWNGTPVNFYSTFMSGGGTAVWGVPTSSPKPDPHNPNFVYQRFQNGILFYDASSGTTAALPLGAFLKAQLTSDSPLLKVVAATQTDLSDAFVPDVS